MAQRGKIIALCAAGALGSLSLFIVAGPLFLHAWAPAPVMPGATDVVADEASGVRDLARGGLSRPPEQYQAIAANNLFKPWQPDSSESQGGLGPDDGAGSGGDGPPPPPRDKLFLVGMTCLRGKVAAYVRREDRPHAPVVVHRLDEGMDDGRLLLVRPDGVVVQVQQPGGEKPYFYPLGDSFVNRRLLTAAQYPEIWEEARRASLP